MCWMGSIKRSKQMVFKKIEHGSGFAAFEGLCHSKLKKPGRIHSGQYRNSGTGGTDKLSNLSKPLSRSDYSASAQLQPYNVSGILIQARLEIHLTQRPKKSCGFG